MQNYYAVERFVQERQEEGRAIAELQALRRRAVAARRAERLPGLRGWLRDLFAERDARAEPAGDTR
jgi:hypothetical protein